MTFIKKYDFKWKCIIGFIDKISVKHKIHVIYASYTAKRVQTRKNDNPSILRLWNVNVFV